VALQGDTCAHTGKKQGEDKPNGWHRTLVLRQKCDCSAAKHNPVGLTLWVQGQKSRLPIADCCAGLAASGSGAPCRCCCCHAAPVPPAAWVTGAAAAGAAPLPAAPRAAAAPTHPSTPIPMQVLYALCKPSQRHAPPPTIASRHTDYAPGVTRTGGVDFPVTQSVRTTIQDPRIQRQGLRWASLHKLHCFHVLLTE
jgi:hypothetical protein